jgi:hypothetical protein
MRKTFHFHKTMIIEKMLPIIGSKSREKDHLCLLIGGDSAHARSI